MVGPGKHLGVAGRITVSPNCLGATEELFQPSDLLGSTAVTAQHPAGQRTGLVIMFQFGAEHVVDTEQFTKWVQVRPKRGRDERGWMPLRLMPAQPCQRVGPHPVDIGIVRMCPTFCGDVASNPSGENAPEERSLGSIAVGPP